MSALKPASRPCRSSPIVARWHCWPATLQVPSWTLFGEFRRQEKVGTGLTSASFLTEAVQLPQPIDYVTDSFEAGAAWAGRIASFRLSYLGSWFEDDNDSLTFANPYLPIVPGSTQGISACHRATPCSSSLHPAIQLPWYATLTYAASLGSLRQNDAFLPVSTLPGPVYRHRARSMAMCICRITRWSWPRGRCPKLSIRGNAAYDGRDDKTSRSPSPTS